MRLIQTNLPKTFPRHFAAATALSSDATLRRAVCSCAGGVRPGSGSLIDRPEHRGAVGDEERSDSGPLDTP